jgi:hypothetical protein
MSLAGDPWCGIGMQKELRMTMQIPLLTVALLAVAFTAAPASAQTTPETNRPWCGIVGSDWECVYQTLPDCERWMRPEGQMCAPNPRGEEER